MNADWLKSQFALHPDLTKSDLARALSLDAPAVSKILSGVRRIKAEEYVAMRRFFGLPTDGARVASTSSDYVLSPLPGHLGESDVPAAQDQWIMPASLFARRTAASPDKIKIFTVHENAMLPEFQDGEPVLVDLSDTDPARPGNFVVSDGFSHIVRHCAYVPHSRPPLIRITAHSVKIAPYEVTADKAMLVGRVIAKLQWL